MPDVDQSSQPSASNLPGARFPRIEPDGRVTFRVVAPAARSVQLRPPGGSLGSGPVDLVPESDGEHWSATIGPVPPGFYYYWLTVDGTDMNDPGTQTYIGHGRAVSGLEVPDPANLVVERHDIPRGEVRHRWYLAETTGTWRRLVVYTPPRYDDDPSARYPVLYLQHGSGEDETGWTAQGRTDVILDNLIAAGDAVPMIVVMASGYVTPPEPDAPRTPERSHAASMEFARLQLAEVVPTVDHTYRTIADRSGRAIAGLSMGGRQAIDAGLGHSGTFAWMGGLSAAVFRGVASGFPSGEDYVGGAIGDGEYQPQQVFLSAGTDEERFVEALQALVPQLEARGATIVTYLSPGTAHEWQTWRRSLIELAPLLFR